MFSSLTLSFSIVAFHSPLGILNYSIVSNSASWPFCFGEFYRYGFRIQAHYFSKPPSVPALVLVWMIAPEASKALKELKHCSCRKNYDGRCICGRFEFACTEQCKCDCQCSENERTVWLNYTREIVSITGY